MRKLGIIFQSLKKRAWFNFFRKNGGDKFLIKLYSLLVLLRGKDLIKVSRGNYLLNLDPRDETITKTYLLYGGYEEFSKDYVINNLHFDLFIDIGANIGDWSVCIAASSPNVKVLAFEPHPDIFNILQLNVIDNHLTNVSCFNVGIGPEAGVMELYCNPDNFGDNSLVGQNHFWPKHDVAVMNIGGYIEGSMDFNCLLKLDVQGFEYEILNSLDKNWLDSINVLMELDVNYRDMDLFKWVNHQLNNGRRIDILLQDRVLSRVSFEVILTTLEDESFFDILLWKS